MPPRKRTPSAPKAEPEQEPLAPEGEADDQQADADDSTEETPEQAPGDGDDKSDEDEAPERSDLQTADKPCEECMPNGWPEGAFSVGCTHGTWVREQA